jgi:PAS domain S-box-containing protein
MSGSSSLVADMLSSPLVRSVLDSAPDAMIIIDSAGTVVFANQQVAVLFGYSREEITGQPVELLLPERFRHRHVAHRTGYTSNVRVRPMGIGLDLFARRKDGTEFPVEISLSPIWQEGEVLSAAAIRDVTERKKTEQILKDTRAEADRANVAKSRFLATASHDLRQPLQSLALLNGTLQRLVSEPDALEALEQQEQAIGAMSRLLNALLDISKLESGAIKPEITNFAVASLFEELRAEFASLAANKGLQLKVDPAEDYVRSDPSLVGQVLRNLISNAIKYTRQGWVQLRCLHRDSAVCIEVLDTGIGIPADQIAFIYDEFYQVGVAANSSRDGYGLGLSIVQRLVKLLDLHLDVRSEVGAGSAFSIELPAGQTASPDIRRASQPRRTAGDSGIADKHLLLVEDDPAVRSATRMLLKVEGYRVTAVASLAEAREALQANPDIQAVVTDYHLARGETGIQVVEAARDLRGAGLKAVLVTGDTSSAVQALICDPNLKIASKPVKADELLSLLKALLLA